MGLFKCSKCGKEVFPEMFRNLHIKTYGKVVDTKNRFCKCEIPDTNESRERYDRETGLIVEVMKNMSMSQGQGEGER